MLDGVKIKKLKLHKDIPDQGKSGEAPAGEKPGILAEVLRADEGLLKKFGQTVFTISYKGAVKAFHWHKLQDDLWFVASGKAKIVLYDKREDSPTYKQTQVIYAGTDDYKLVLIPTGVIHGYKVVSNEPVFLFYTVTETYNPETPDEHRVAYDDPEVNFNWDEN